MAPLSLLLCLYHSGSVKYCVILSMHVLNVCAGTVLVTFKSHTMSVPPYRIENQCSDVHIYLVQACLAGERPGRWIWLPPRAAGSSLAYAWDEPNEEHRLRVKVCLPHYTH